MNGLFPVSAISLKQPHKRKLILHPDGNLELIPIVQRFERAELLNFLTLCKHIQTLCICGNTHDYFGNYRAKEEQIFRICLFLKKTHLAGKKRSELEYMVLEDLTNQEASPSSEVNNLITHLQA